MINHLITKTTLVLIGIIVFSACTLIQVENEKINETKSPNKEIITEKVELKKIPKDMPVEFERVWQTWEILRKEHLNKDTITADQMSQAAVEGMLKSLDDRYASYMDKTATNRLAEELRGSYQGIGASVSLRNNQIVIVEPFPNSPAKKAGIQAGDIVLAINGQPTMGMNLQEAVALVRGPEGTSVELTVKHQGANTTSEKITVIRGEIKVSSTTLEITDENYGYLIIKSFSNETDDQVARLLKEAQSKKIHALIIDLRNNLGGTVNSVLNISNEFIDGGLIFYSIDSDKNRKNYVANKGGSFTTNPIVILVNPFSASASEVLAGTLQQNRNATIIGTKTYGKGNVGIFHELNEKDGINFSIAAWYLPNGDRIEGNGIEPDINPSTEDTTNTGDIVYNKAIEVLNKLFK